MEVLLPRKELLPKVIELMKKEKVTTAPILARKLGVGKPTAYTLLNYLVYKGLVEKKPLGKDVVYIYIGE